MQTITIDILNYKVEKLLEDLEHLQLIRLRKENHQRQTVINWTGKFQEPEIAESQSFSENLEANLPNGNL